MNLLAEIRETKQGIETLSDWLGKGLMHVSQETADHRSLSCIQSDTGEPCPHNKAPHWWECHKGAIADAIKAQIEIKEKIRLKTTFDDSLHMCAICGCCLKLKVWVPIDTVADHTAPDHMQKYPSFCWQRKGIEALSSTQQFHVGNE
jgi:hypothetical protein